MKKTFLLLVAMLMMGSAAFAGGGFGLAIGPKVGYQTAKLSGNKADIKADFANHFSAGLFGRVNIGHFYVQPEVLYFKTSNIFDASVTGVQPLQPSYWCQSQHHLELDEPASSRFDRLRDF